jgi:hypothetical protein
MLVHAEWVRSVALVAMLMCLAPAAAQGGNSVWLTLDSPTDWEPDSIVDWLEVSGRAGLLDVAPHDIVIAIDLSDSAMRDSGMDMDGDLERRSTSPATIATLGLGEGDGLLLRRLRLILDFDDTVLMTELAAAKALIDELPLGPVRVSIIGFSEEVEVMSPLTADRDALERGLERARRSLRRHLRSTNFANAIEASSAILAPPPRKPSVGEAPQPFMPQDRKRSIVFLSDGKPTGSESWTDAQDPIEAARDAASSGVKIYPFALGPEADVIHDAYQAIARTTGGALERLITPDEIVARLRAIDLVGVTSVQIENLTTGSPAHAVRRLENGSFDGFVELAPGDNRIRVVASLRDGQAAVLERTVHRRDAASLDAEASELATQELVAILDHLRVRTIEMELLAEIQRVRFRKQVEITASSPKGASTE